MASPKASNAKKPSAASIGGAEERDLQSFREIADDVIESDFVPYACLYNPTTIITKDGELLQTIKITGLGFEAGIADLRQAIRRAIRESIPDETYAIWMHTLRRQQSLLRKEHFPDSFSGQLDEAWRASQPTSAFFVNELYITIVKASETAGIYDAKNFLKSLRLKKEYQRREEEIGELSQGLSKTTAKMLQHLQAYGAKLLSVVEREGSAYSEQLEFLEKLINLEERPMKVPMRDLSHVLTSGEITFGFNAMEVRTEEGHRRFAAIMTLKEYKESTLAGIDKFLEIPCEVIVSQCFSFTGADKAQEMYSKQARYLTGSGDKELARWIEIDRLTRETNETKRFGEQQTTLFLIAPSVRQLESNVKMVQKALTRLGMVVVREDLRFEECYWGLLPANFPFVVRKKPVDTEHLAGFANLQSTPQGMAAGSPWGPATSLFTTVQDTPYYFNFHRGHTAHTIVLGKPGSGRTSFTHFLLAQARKLPLAIWYLDAHGRAGPFLQAMGGQYLRPGTAALKLNPFHLPQSPGNREFLALWLSTLIDPSGQQLTRSSLAFFQSLVDHMYTLPLSQRRLSALIPLAREADALLAMALQPFCAGGAFGELFDMPEDTFATSNLIGWDISPWITNAQTRVPLLSYLLHQLTGRLTGNPTLLVMDEGFRLLDTPLYAARVGPWADYFAAQNSALLLTTDAVSASGVLPFTPSLSQKAATIFAMPDSLPDAEYAMGFGFTEQDYSALAYLEASKRHVLQKRGTESHVLTVNFNGFTPMMRSTLSGKTKPPPSATPADQLAALMGLGKQPA